MRGALRTAQDALAEENGLRRAEIVGVDDGRYDARAAERRPGARVGAAASGAVTHTSAAAHARDGHLAALSFMGAQCVSDHGACLGRRLSRDLHVSYATAAARERGETQTK
jgi:hypothetical protein